MQLVAIVYVLGLFVSFCVTALQSYGCWPCRCDLNLNSTPQGNYNTYHNINIRRHQAVNTLHNTMEV